MSDHAAPLIHCTPPSDARFLASVTRAFHQASQLLAGDLAVLVGTIVRLRGDYPTASIIAVSIDSLDGDPCPMWLVSRDGWTEIHDLPVIPWPAPWQSDLPS